MELFRKTCYSHVLIWQLVYHLNNVVSLIVLEIPMVVRLKNHPVYVAQNVITIWVIYKIIQSLVESIIYAWINFCFYIYLKYEILWIYSSFFIKFLLLFPSLMLSCSPPLLCAWFSFWLPMFSWIYEINYVK